MKFKRFICSGLILSVLISGAVGINVNAQTATEGVSAEQSLDAVNVYIVGDSTACVYGTDENYAIPRAGWGMYLGKYLYSKAYVKDLALAGRSSKSFTTEDNYKEVFEKIKEGDYLLIQFGHNDEKNTKPEDIEERYTDPSGSKETEGSFKNSLYENYIKPAQEKGAIPILMTPVSRRKFDENGKVTDSHTTYDDAIRELGRELNIRVIDMTGITSDIYEGLGVEGTKMIHAAYYDRTKGENGLDNTHFSHIGGNFIAATIANELKEIDGIGKYVNESAFNDSENYMLTRGEFVSLIMRMLDLKADNAEYFADVNKDSPNAEQIAAAKALKIVNGNIDGLFKPYDYITRQDMSVIASRAAECADIDLDSDMTVLDKYTDKDFVQSYARQSYAQMLNMEAIAPLTDTELYPAEYVLKTEAAKLLNKLYEAAAPETEDTEQTQTIEDLEKVENTNN